MYIFVQVYIFQEQRHSRGSICKFEPYFKSTSSILGVLLRRLYFVFTFLRPLLCFCTCWACAWLHFVWREWVSVVYVFVSAYHSVFSSSLFLAVLCAFYLVPWSNEVLRYVDGWKRIRTKGNRHAHPVTGNDDDEEEEEREEERKMNTIQVCAHFACMSCFDVQSLNFRLLYSISKCANTIALCVPKNTKINRVSLSLAPSLGLSVFLHPLPSVYHFLRTRTSLAFIQRNWKYIRAQDIYYHVSIPYKPIYGKSTMDAMKFNRNFVQSWWDFFPRYIQFLCLRFLFIEKHNQRETRESACVSECLSEGAMYGQLLFQLHAWNVRRTFVGKSTTAYWCTHE